WRSTLRTVSSDFSVAPATSRASAEPESTTPQIFPAFQVLRLFLREIFELTRFRSTLTTALTPLIAPTIYARTCRVGRDLLAGRKRRAAPDGVLHIGRVIERAARLVKGEGTPAAFRPSALPLTASTARCDRV